MKAYGKKLVLATLIIMPYTFTQEGVGEQGMPDTVQAMILDAQQKVATAAYRAREVQESLNKATQSRFALQVMTDEILQTPLEDLTGSIEVINALFDRTSQLLQSQSAILHILNEQLPSLAYIEREIKLVRDYQERIQAQADNQTAQSIEGLLGQLLIHKNSIEEAIQDIKEFAHEAVRKIYESITKIKQAVEQSENQPDQAREITAQIITLLLEIEQSIQTLLDRDLHVEASEAAVIAQNLQRELLILTPDDIPAMQAREQQAKNRAEQVRSLISVPLNGGPAGTPSTPGQPTARPGQQPAAPTAAPQSPTASSGRALSNINKANTKLESAILRLDVVKGYFNQIDTTEQAIVKKQVASIFKEYEAGLKKFSERIKQVKASNARLDQQKLAPFDRFLALTDKLSAKVKNP